MRPFSAVITDVENEKIIVRQ